MRSRANVGRFLVAGVFLALAGPTAAEAAQLASEAVREPALNAWLIAVYGGLKTVIVLAFLVFVIKRDAARRRSRDPIAFVACAAAIVTVVALRRPDDSAVTGLIVAGEAVTVLSCAWMLAAVLALGRCFGVLPEARGLVMRGPYALVRHPIYLGELGICAGLVIASPGAWNVTMAVIFAAAQAVRIRLEEKALAKEFDRYVDYAANTPRLVPRLRSVRAR